MRKMLQAGCALGALAILASCGYGKDTGPKQPKAQKQFEPLVDRFVKRSQSCFGDMFQVNMGRPVAASERADTAKVSKAMVELRKELLGCLTGKGYGNEIQVEASVVDAWMAKTGCAQFAAAAFKAPQCIAIQSVLEEAGFNPDAAPGAKPPKKKRPAATPPSGK